MGINSWFKLGCPYKRNSEFVATKLQLLLLNVRPYITSCIFLIPQEWLFDKEEKYFQPQHVKNQ